MGYGGTFHESGESLNTVVGMVRLGYKIGEKAILHVGFERLFHISYYANYYVDNKPFVGLDWRPIRWLELRLNAAYHHMSFGKFNFQQQGKDGQLNTADDMLPNNKYRVDHGVNGSIEAEFDALRYLGFTIGYRIDARFSDFLIQTAAQEVVDYVDFTRHTVFANVMLRY